MRQFYKYLERVYNLIRYYDTSTEYAYIRCLYGALLYCQPWPDSHWLAGPMYRKAIEELGEAGETLMFGSIADEDIRRKAMDLIYAKMIGAASDS
jgi:hypothetical protein